MEDDIPIAPSLYSLSNKMDNSLLAVRDINHKYIVVEKICGSLLNVAGRRLSESRVRENLMHGLRWQAMETETTAPSLDPTLIRPSSGKDTAKTKGVLFIANGICGTERVCRSVRLL